MKRGFTLIELLVVVLIIGILSAVAFPMYQKAVGKARVAEAKIGLNALSKAGKIFYMETGETPSWQNLSSFSIEIPNSQNWTFENDECCSGNGKVGCSWFAGYTKEDVQILLIEKDYSVACGDSLIVEEGFFCHGAEEKCKNFGFTINSGEGEYREL